MTKAQKPSRKRRAASYASLKRQADALASEWTRRKNADSAGFVRCITCGNTDHWKRMQCSHYVSRVHLSTRFLEQNMAPACYACNVLRRGNMAEYTLWITAKHGSNIIQELVDLKHKSVKFTRTDLQDLIEGYKVRLAELSLS